MEFIIFEGNQSGDEVIVFAISSRKYGVKGIVYNAFANYNEREHSLDLMLRLQNILKFILRLK